MEKGMAMADRESRRLRRIERRRQEILDAAARIFAKKGYHETTAKEIAEAVDIAEGTLYHYFESKGAILVAILEEMGDTVERMLQQADHLASRQDLVDLITDGYRVFTSRLAFFRTLFIEAWLDDAVLQAMVIERMQNLGQRIQAFVVRRIQQGIFRPIDPDLTARIIISMFVVPLAPVMRGMQPPPTPEECCVLAETVIDILFDGLCVRPAPGASAGC